MLKLQETARSKTRYTRYEGQNTQNNIPET